MITLPGLSNRFDYFLIWGNGLEHKEEIIEIIRNQSNFTILKIIKYKPRNIKKLIKAVYSYDYAPFRHLKNKTKYLLTTKPEVLFIFIENKMVRENIFGHGQFTHVECETIKNIKNIIRDRFNKKSENRRSENHVIHASDNELQTDYMLKFLGYPNGVNLIKNNPNKFIRAPHHIKPFNEFEIISINMNKLYCGILSNNNRLLKIKLTNIEDTPHFLYLCGKKNQYKNYLKKYEGKYLQDGYSCTKLEKLSKTFSYLENTYSNDYILTRKIEGERFQILDGVHRASIMKYNGHTDVIVAVIK